MDIFEYNILHSKLRTVEFVILQHYEKLYLAI